MDGSQVGIPLHGTFQVQSADERTGGSMIETTLGFFTVLVCIGPSDRRWAERSITYQGIADAMAEQWGAISAVEVAA